MGATELAAFDAAREARDRSAAAVRDRANFEVARRAMLAADVGLVGLGSLLLSASPLGSDAAFTFASGGAVGLAYLSLLSRSVASLGTKDAEDEKEGGFDVRLAVDAAVSFPGTRLLLVAVLTYLVVSSRIEAGGGADEEVLATILEAAAGVLAYKAAVLLVTAAGPSERETQRDV